LGEAVSAWEQKFGPLTEAEIGNADIALDRAAKKRRRGAA
jgi:hypothetical protein